MSSSINSPERTTVVASWTTLKIPASSTFENWRTEDGRTWLSIIRPMTSAKQQGFLHGAWARPKKGESVVWLVTSWHSSDALEKFEASSTWSTQRELLASMSMAPPATVYVELDGTWWDRERGETGLVDLSFPANISLEVRSKIEETLTTFYSFHPEGIELKAYGAASVHGWIREPARYVGQDTATLRIIEHWSSKEKKEKFKTKATVFEEGADILLYDRFLKQLEELGMVGLKEEHCTFSHIPKTFR